MDRFQGGVQLSFEWNKMQNLTPEQQEIIRPNDHVQVLELANESLLFVATKNGLLLAVTIPDLKVSIIYTQLCTFRFMKISPSSTNQQSSPSLVILDDSQNLHLLSPDPTAPFPAYNVPLSFFVFFSQWFIEYCR